MALLNPEEFRAAASELVRAWEVCTQQSDIPPFRWISFSQHPRGLPAPDSAEGYLSLEDVLVLSPVGKSEEQGSLTEELCDDISTARFEEPRYSIYTYHILFSESYRVPTLFFNAKLPDGRQLSFEQVEKQLPHSSSEELKRHPWTFLTLEDHPYVHSPWFTLHPCGTSGLMETIFRDGSRSGHLRTTSPDKNYALRYLLTWLSLSGEAAGMNLPSETFAHLCRLMIPETDANTREGKELCLQTVEPC